eukprot:CAMPEP_0119406676 /NCGR_PEP_ID=MMETSP1335-20130426/913_1 /TAXON_ID=259385 /ORGANISM="Chrysoculter rhomboideus, Strain RCC1486" /LENGTH=110 /DNA_ID=CAMNT_0007430765 /DNA_START=68 /DNA_END=401 /DNA_ORIENTATION=+
MHVDALDDLDDDVIDELLVMYESDFQRLINFVRSQCSSVDCFKDPIVKAAVHRIKGDSITVGLDEVVKLFEMLEQCASPMSIIDAACAQVAAGISELRDGAGGGPSRGDV